MPRASKPAPPSVDESASDHESNAYLKEDPPEADVEGGENDAESDAGDEPKGIKDGLDLKYTEEWTERFGSVAILLADLEPELDVFKKSHKNALPADGKTLYAECKSVQVVSPKSDEDFELLHTTVFGKKNAEGKVDAAAFKESLRGQWKGQREPTKRDPESAGFKLFEDESYQQVEQAYIEALDAHLKRINDRAEKMDAGHRPDGILRKAQKERDRADEARDKRKERVEAGQKKRREAETSKKRKGGEKKMTKKQWEAEVTDPAVEAEKTEKIRADAARDLTNELKKLMDGGMSVSDAFAKMRNEINA